MLTVLAAAPRRRVPRHVAPPALLGARLGALLLAAGCGGGEGPHPTETPPPPPPTGVTPVPPAAPSYAELWIERGVPDPRVLAADTVEQYGGVSRFARARLADGSVVAARVTWASGDSTILRVVGTSTSDAVTVVPGVLGATTLTARLGALAATVPVLVTPPRVRGASLRRAPSESLPVPTAMCPTRLSTWWLPGPSALSPTSVIRLSNSPRAVTMPVRAWIFS